MEGAEQEQRRERQTLVGQWANFLFAYASATSLPSFYHAGWQRLASRYSPPPSVRTVSHWPSECSTQPIRRL